MSKQTFEKAMKKLEQIVQELETGTCRLIRQSKNLKKAFTFPSSVPPSLMKPKRRLRF